MPVSEFACSILDAAAVALALRFREGFFGAVDLAATDRADVVLSLRRLVSRFASIQTDMAAELACASSGMTTPFPCAIFFAYNICAGVTALGSVVPGISSSTFLGACSLRNLRQIDIEVL